MLAAATVLRRPMPTVPALLDEALDVLLTRFWDDDNGMVVEEWDESLDDA